MIQIYDLRNMLLQILPIDTMIITAILQVITTIFKQRRKKVQLLGFYTVNAAGILV